MKTSPFASDPTHPRGPKADASRRRLLQGFGLAAAGAAGGLAPSLVPSRARAQGVEPAAPGVITRAVPRTKELLPAVGLGSFLTFDLLPGQKREHLREVLRRYWEAGARVLDTSPLYGTGETSVGDFVAELGAADRLFIANKLWTTGDFLADDSHARRSFEQSQLRLWRERFDLMQCHSLVNVDVAVPLLAAWKKEGRTRHVGVTHHENVYHPVLAAWIERGVVDFVQVNYSIFNRNAEREVFPAAQQRGTAVLVNMALEKARLHKIVQGRALPAFAREFGAENWAQFFVKYVVSHPAVTCCLTATSDPAHAAENVGALRGALPDAPMRERMVRHMEGISGFATLAQMPWYPDKRYPGIIGRAQADIRARS